MRGKYIIERAIKPDDKVLDIGGAFHPCHRADYIIDIVPYDFYGDMTKRAYPPGYEKCYFSEKTYIQRDICDREPFPFEDKYFDFVIASQVLEDIRDPVFVCSEIIRIGKRGYIETPSRYSEQTLRGRICEYSHHRWLVDYADNKLEFTYKPHKLHFNSRFYLLPPPKAFGINPKYEVIGFLWETQFDYRENCVLTEEDMSEYLSSIHGKVRGIEDYFVPESCIGEGFELVVSPKKVLPGTKAVPAIDGYVRNKLSGVASRFRL